MIKSKYKIILLWISSLDILRTKKASTIHQIIIMRLFFISFINHATNTLSAVVLRKFINVTTMLSLRHSLSSD